MAQPYVTSTLHSMWQCVQSFVADAGNPKLSCVERNSVVWCVYKDQACSALGSMLHVEKP